MRIEKLKLFSLSLVIIFMLGMVSIPTIAVDNNLIANYDPSFETGTYGAGMTQTTADKVSGNFSGSVIAGTYTQRFFPAMLLPDTKYTFSVWVKALSPTNNAFIKLNYKDASDDSAKNAQIVVTGTPAPFKKYSVEFTTPSLVGTLDPYNQFSISFYTTSDILVDDVAVVDANFAYDSYFTGNFKTKSLNPSSKLIEFTSSTNAVDFKAFVDYVSVPLVKKNVGLNYSLEIDLSGYNSGDSLEVTAFYTGPIGLIDGINYIGGNDIIKPYILQDAPEEIPTATLTPPTINTVTDISTSISGKAKYDGFITVLAGKKTLEDLVVDGIWKINLSSKLVAGTKISVNIFYDDLTSKNKTIFVIPRTPTVSAIKANATYVKGIATKSSVVYAKIGAKNFSAKANSKGVFSIKTTKIKKYASVSVRSKAGGQFSASKVVKAK
ncbi:MAG: hypothetical protein WCL54_00620 [Clostridia bacterium]